MSVIYIDTSKIEARIVNTPDADKIEKSDHFVMNADKLYDLQAPYLELEAAKNLLNSFCIKKNTTCEGYHAIGAGREA